VRSTSSLTSFRSSLIPKRQRVNSRIHQRVRFQRTAAGRGCPHEDTGLCHHPGRNANHRSHYRMQSIPAEPGGRSIPGLPRRNRCAWTATRSSPGSRRLCRWRVEGVRNVHGRSPATAGIKRLLSWADGADRDRRNKVTGKSAAERTLPRRTVGGGSGGIDHRRTCRGGEGAAIGAGVGASAGAGPKQSPRETR